MELKPLKGRGAHSNPHNRFHSVQHTQEDDGWWQDADDDVPLETEVRAATVRSIITRNQSPDVPFDQSINPYRGCEHGCAYCFARPTHAYYDLSPGLDFETRLFYKPQAAQLLREELSAPGYHCQPMAMGTNTDPYQPIEKQYRVTREVLEVLHACNHPVSIVTKGALILRDLDLLADMASRGLAHVMMSLPTLDRSLKRTLEPRTADPAKRLKVVEALSRAGVPVGVLVAPVIPALTDSEMEVILRRAADAGATHAGYVLLRLPLEVKPLFEQWLDTHQPQRAAHVMSLMEQLHAGRAYDARPGLRQTGQGVFAKLISMRFTQACKRHGLNRDERPPLDCSQFQPPMGQASLF